MGWIEGLALTPEQQESYFEPTSSTEAASLYEHCARALDRSFAVGSHGLPLIGAGDWNDAMNRIGHHGRRESVWLGWFLETNLRNFARIAESRGESRRSASWRSTADSLVNSLEAEGWDGKWYRRAFFDDGSLLGSDENEECRIDAIAQSWAVISGAGDPGWARLAMRSVEERLIRRGDGLMLLFDPPFDKPSPDPGYI